MRGALGPILAGLFALVHATASEDPLCENHCSRLLSPNKEQDNLWGTTEACRVGCRFKKLDSFQLLEANTTCHDSCLEAFSTEPSQMACLEGCSVALNTTNKMMSASGNRDGLLQLLASFLQSGHPLSTAEHSPEVHVLDVTIVTMADPNNPDRTIQKITLLEGNVPLTQEDSHTGAAPVETTLSSTLNSSSDWDSDTRLIQCLIFIQFLLIVTMGLSTVFLCCYIFRKKSKDAKDVTEILRIAEESRRLCRLPGAAMGNEFVTGQLYKPPLPPTYQEALEQSEVVLRLAVSKKPKIVEGILTVVPNKRQLQQPPDNAVTQN